MNLDQKRGESEELNSVQENEEQDSCRIIIKEVRKVKPKTKRKRGLKKHHFAEDLKGIHQVILHHIFVCYLTFTLYLPF